MEKLSGEQVKRFYKEAKAIRGLVKDVPGVFLGRASLLGWVDGFLKKLPFPQKYFRKGSWSASNKMLESLRLGQEVPHFHRSLVNKRSIFDILAAPHAQKLNPFAERELRRRVGEIARRRGWIPPGLS